MSFLREYDDLKCSICIEVFENPVRISCQHVFCESCIIDQLKWNSHCPLCKADVDIKSKRQARDTKRRIEDSTAACEHCRQNVKLKDMRDHSLNCPSIPVRPKFKSVGKTSQPVPPSGANRSTFTCPYCPQSHLDIEALRTHCNSQHKNGQKNVVCPVCASMPWGDPNMQSSNFLDHLNNRHKFEYETYVDYSQDDDEMLRAAIEASLTDG